MDRWKSLISNYKRVIICLDMVVSSADQCSLERVLLHFLVECTAGITGRLLEVTGWRRTRHRDIITVFSSIGISFLFEFRLISKFFHVLVQVTHSHPWDSLRSGWLDKKNICHLALWLLPWHNKCCIIEREVPDDHTNTEWSLW